jgi:hypothetical protein
VQLVVTAADKACILLVPGVLSAARQWPALKQVDLVLKPRHGRQQPLLPLDYQTSSALSSVPAVQQLQRLVLDVPEFGECSAAITGQLVQLTQLTASGPTAAAADLTALSALTNLVELVLIRPPAVKPAAAAAAAAAAAGAGPYCLPSSLRRLEIRSSESAGSDAEASAAVPSVAPWVTHLAGCPHLQHLELQYHGKDHPNAHPSAVVRLLGQHNKQLRSLVVAVAPGMEWNRSVLGLPDAVLGPAEWQWRPDAALASLTGLEHLATDMMLHILNQTDWRHLAQLTALTKLSKVGITVPPWLQQGASLALLELTECKVHLSGTGLGRLLLACPALKRAEVFPQPPCFRAWSVPADNERLPPHPTLQRLELQDCGAWGSAEVAAARFSELAPALAGVSDMRLVEWPLLSPSDTGPSVPDLSACTGLTSLAFGCDVMGAFDAAKVVHPEQEDFLSMLAPLARLRRLSVQYAQGLNARAAVPLQLLLPELQSVVLKICGILRRVAAGDQLQQEQEQQMLVKVKQLLRPGLVLEVV